MILITLSSPLVPESGIAPHHSQPRRLKKRHGKTGQQYHQPDGERIADQPSGRHRLWLTFACLGNSISPMYIHAGGLNGNTNLQE